LRGPRAGRPETPPGRCAAPYRGGGMGAAIARFLRERRPEGRVRKPARSAPSTQRRSIRAWCAGG